MARYPRRRPALWGCPTQIEWLSVEDASEYLGIARDTTYRYIRDEGFPPPIPTVMESKS